jgi:hypothetical protein
MAVFHQKSLQINDLEFILYTIYPLANGAERRSGR